MNRFLFCSHGRMAEGMLDTLKIFSLYNPESMQAIAFYTESMDGEAMLKKAMAQISPEDQVVIFTDVLFGSVNQLVMQLYQNSANVHIVSGMNLMIVLELTAADQLTETLIAEKCESARSSIVYTKTLRHKPQEEDE